MKFQPIIYIFGGWLPLFLISLFTETPDAFHLESAQYRSDMYKFNKCKTDKEYLYHCEEECAYLTLNKPKFWNPFLNRLTSKLKWCGIDQCESIFTMKGITMSVLIYFLIKATPTISKKGMNLLKY